MLALTRQLLRAGYQGDLAPWLSYHYAGTVYLGSSDPILVGSQAIARYYSTVAPARSLTVVDENYSYLPAGPEACCVYGSMVIADGQRRHGAVSRFSLTYGIVAGELKILQEHISYEYLQMQTDCGSRSISLDMQTLRFVRQLLLSHPIADRICVKSGKQTIFVNPYLIQYVQSDGKHSELCCIDRTISCSYSISEIAKLLPFYFYSIHRSYIVNTYYVQSLHRFEVALKNGMILPVPEHQYSRVKADFHRLLHLQDGTGGGSVRDSEE